MINSIDIKFVIEALLFCSEKPLTVAQLRQHLVAPSIDINELTESADASCDEQSSSTPEPESEMTNPTQESPVYLATTDEIHRALTELQQDYHGRGIRLQEVASGFRFQSCEEVKQWVLQTKSHKPPRYSRALLETLAIIAYKQPITRAEIEDVRGIAVSSHIIKTLQERDWIRVVGHKDVPGKPALMATTRGFLDYFNLRYLQDLPALTDLRQGVTETTNITV